MADEPLSKKLERRAKIRRAAESKRATNAPRKYLPGERTAGQVGEGANVGIANVVGAPVDAANWLLDTVGFGSDQPVLGSDWWVNLFEKTGVGATPEEGLPGKIGQEIGENTVGFGVLGGFAKAGKFGKYTRPLVEYVASNPLKAFVGDVAMSVPAGTGAHVGREVGEEVGAPNTGETVGRLVSGGVPAAAVGGAKAVAKTIDTAFGVRPQTVEKMAADELRGAMSRPATEDAILSEDIVPPAFGRPTTGEIYDDPGLMSYERSVSDRNPQSVGRSQAIRREHTASIHEGLKQVDGGGSVTTATSAFESRVRESVKKIEDSVAAIRKKAAAAVERATKSGDGAPQTKARKELDTALKAARAEESRLWKDVGSGEYDVTGVKDAARKVIADQTKADTPSDLHPLIYKLAGKESAEAVNTGILDEFGNPITKEQLISRGFYNDVEDISEITALNSRLLGEIRKENAAGNWQRARNLKLVQEKIFDLIVPRSAADDVIDKLDAARKFSLRLNQIFTHDESAVSKILGYSKSGGRSVSPELTLETVVVPGTRGGMAVRSLRQAAGERSADIDASITEFLTAKFAARTIDPVTGDFSPQAATAFITQYGDALDQLPTLKATLSNAASAQKAANSVSKLAQKRIKKIESYSTAAKFVNGDPSAKISAALDAPSHKEMMERTQSLINSAKKSENPEAVLDGIRSAFYDQLVARVAPDTRADLVSGMTAVKPQELRKFINKYSGVITKLYSGTALKFLREVARGAEMGARFPQGRARHGGSDTQGKAAANVRRVVGSLGVIIGTRLGRLVGANQLLIAGTGRRAALATGDSVINAEADRVIALVEDALKDPSLARALLAANPARAVSPSHNMTIMKYFMLNDLATTTPGMVGEE